MRVKKSDSFNKMIKYVSERIGSVLKLIEPKAIEDLCEIRLRAENPVILIFTSDRKFITGAGRLTPFFSDNLLTATSGDITDTFNRLCEYSVHSHTDTIANGFITVGANRVGVYGTAVTQGEKVVSVRNIRGLNIRISAQYDDVARPISDTLYMKDTVNTLICGPPSSGKTTILRDLCRILSDERGMKMAAIDERGEMSGFNLGRNTDILMFYPKAHGIETAVRTLSPEMIVCDEIGTVTEVEAVTQGLNSGVNFVMSIHCRSYSELLKKPQFSALRAAGAVDFCVFLEEKCRINSIISVKESNDESCSIDSIGNCMQSFGTVHSLQA